MIKINIIKYPKLEERERTLEETTLLGDLLEKASKCGHYESALLFVELVKESFIVEGTKSDGCMYVWHPQRYLWIEMDKNACYSWFPSVMKPLIEKTICAVSDKIQKSDDKAYLDSAEIVLRMLRNLNTKYSSLPFITNVLKIAFPLLKRPDISLYMNYSKNYLPVKLGYKIDLRTGLQSLREKEDFFSFECPVDYHISYENEEEKLKYEKDVEDFFNAVFLDNQEVIEYMRTLIGYILTGETSEQKIFIFYGDGANGKSTLIIILGIILGKFFYQASKDVFIQCGKAVAGANSPHLVPLQGKRGVAFSESDTEDKLSEGQIKAFRGGEPITCMPKYKEQITFPNNAKGVMCTNNLPQCSCDEALWRSLIMLLFGAKFVENPKEGTNERKVNLKFSEKFNDPKFKSAFLRWCVQGSITWYAEGLKEPESILKATNSYKESVNIYEQFVEERLTKVYVEEIVQSGVIINPNRFDVKYKISGSALYDNFKVWYASNGFKGKVPSNKFFGIDMKKLLWCNTHYDSLGNIRPAVIRPKQIFYLGVKFYFGEDNELGLANI